MNPEMQLDLEIYPIWYTPIIQRLTFKLLIAFVILGILSIIVFSVLKFRKREKKTYWQEALEKLSLLENNSDNLSSRERYAQLIDILKQYLNIRYNLDLSAATDLELINILVSTVDSSYINGLSTLLSHSYRAKFEPDFNTENINVDIKFVMHFVQQLSST